MPIMFNSLLEGAGVAPSRVRLIRHAPIDSRIVLLRDVEERRVEFEQWQQCQLTKDHAHFDSSYWAVFIGLPDGRSQFIRLYEVLGHHPLENDEPCALTGGVVHAKVDERWILGDSGLLSEFERLLYVLWGSGTRAWRQRAERQNKEVAELRADLTDPPYPGHGRFLRQLSDIPLLPGSWREVLRNVRGVYVLTCPKTNELYIGGAFAAGGFYERWLTHYDRQGDAVRFRSREPSDYRVAILEVAGSYATDDEICDMESRWKEKLQTRSMGLNAN